MLALEQPGDEHEATTAAITVSQFSTPYTRPVELHPAPPPAMVLGDEGGGDGGGVTNLRAVCYSPKLRLSPMVVARYTVVVCTMCCVCVGGCVRACMHACVRACERACVWVPARSCARACVSVERAVCCVCVCAARESVRACAHIPVCV